MQSKRHEDVNTVRKNDVITKSKQSSSIEAAFVLFIYYSAAQEDTTVVAAHPQLLTSRQN